MNANSLKAVSEDILTILDEAYGVFRSKTYNKFLFIEGSTDKKFLRNKGYPESHYFYLGMNGKPTVLAGHEIYHQHNTYNKIKKMAFLIDNDYDHVLNQIHAHSDMFVHSYCPHQNEHYLNDLEVYLTDSDALFSWLEEYNLNRVQINKLKQNVMLESKRLGKYRAANELLKKIKMLDEKSTILFDIEIFNFMDIDNFLFLQNKFESTLRHCSKHKEYVDELCLLAEKIDNTFKKDWALSRGHDVTELISIYLFYNHQIDLNRKEIERYLRLSLDTQTFKNYHIDKSLNHFFNN